MPDERTVEQDRPEVERYDFGDQTPEEWPDEYVSSHDYDALEAEIAQLREELAKDKWISVETGGKPVGGYHQLYVQGGDPEFFQCVGYWNRLARTWMVNGESFDGLCVTHWKPLPSAPAPEKEKP